MCFKDKYSYDNNKIETKTYTPRCEVEKDGIFFATSMGKATEMKHAITFLQEDILRDFCTEEEKKGMSAYSFRRSFGRWGREHEDENIKSRVSKNQDHSQSIFEKAYDIHTCDEASWVAKAVMSQVWKTAPAEVKKKKQKKTDFLLLCS